MEDILTEEEQDRLVLALALTRGHKGVTESEANEAIQWAYRVRIGAVLLELVLEGKTVLDIERPGGEPRFYSVEHVQQRESNRHDGSRLTPRAHQ